MDYQIVVKKGKRYITVPKLSNLGLENYFTTADVNMRIGSPNKPNGNVRDYLDIFDMMEINPREVFSSGQKHTDNITIINKTNMGEPFDVGKIINNNDGLITDIKDIILVSKFADCTPIILFDPVRKVQANIHSGWRGTLKKIGKNASYQMQRRYISDPKNIIAVLGPSIDMFDFEVDEDVMLRFKKTFSYERIILEMKDNKYLINLNKINELLLMESGIPRENIINIDMSTMTSPMLHSYRRDRGLYQLMAVLTGIK